MYNISSTRGWEKQFFLLLSNVLDIRGRVWDGWGTFFVVWGVLNPGFGCIIKLKLTSILAPNIRVQYIQRGGGSFLLTPRGRGVEGSSPVVGTLSKCWYKTQVFRALKNKNSPNFA